MVTKQESSSNQMISNEVNTTWLFVQPKTEERFRQSFLRNRWKYKVPLSEEYFEKLLSECIRVRLYILDEGQLVLLRELCCHQDICYEFSFNQKGGFVEIDDNCHESIYFACDYLELG